MSSNGLQSSRTQIERVSDGGRSVRRVPGTTEMKYRQVLKIAELGDALMMAGFSTLNAKARVLGLPRSTVWTIQNATHKSSGLSARVINRVLAAPQLPPPVGAKIVEYVEEKAAGLYGHSRAQRRRFVANLSPQAVDRTQNKARQTAD